MSAQQIGRLAVREAPVLRADQDVASAVRAIVDSGLPGLPVVGEDGLLCGIFGEREFISSLFPGYLAELKYAGFVTRAIEAGLEKRRACLAERVARHMTTEHVDVAADFSDAQLAEIFLHHRVLIVPVTDGGRVTGVVTRGDFFRALVTLCESDP